MTETKKMFEKHMGLKIINFMDSGYADYISARTLINTNQLIQGCILANTALEKYFKAFMLFKGDNVKKIHVLNKLTPSVFNFDHKLKKVINEEFINLLTLAYLYRYYDDLIPGYNLAIIKRKVLAEIDYIVSELEPKIKYSSSELNKKTTKYDNDVQQKNPLLYQNNYILNNINKKNFIESGPDVVYEIRILPNLDLLEVIYTTNGSKNDHKFIYEALKIVKDNPLSIECTHLKV